jgi:CPA1 family monovalent cation:H+ antiporter
MVVGGILGWGAASLLAQIDDYLVETTMTTCLAFGSYLLAEYLHTSGVLAVVVAGLMCSSLGSKGMSATTKIVVSNFWQYLAFVANSLVFLLIGVTINIVQLGSYLIPILVAIAAVLLSRAVVVYLPTLVSRRTRQAIPMAWQHVLFWGGLRGAVSLALALSLPTDLAARDTLRVMTFGVVLFTLVVQATTMPLVLRRLGLVHKSASRLERDMRLGRLFAAQASWRHLQAMNEEGVLTGEIWRGLEAQHTAERSRLDQAMHALYLEYGELERELILVARRDSLRAERVALSEAMRRGLITEEAFRNLAAEVDQRLEALGLIANPPQESKAE